MSCVVLILMVIIIWNIFRWSELMIIFVAAIKSLPFSCWWSSWACWYSGKIDQLYDNSFFISSGTKVMEVNDDGDTIGDCNICPSCDFSSWCWKPPRMIKTKNYQRSRLCGGEGRGWYDVWLHAYGDKHQYHHYPKSLASIDIYHPILSSRIIVHKWFNIIQFNEVIILL